MYQEAITVGQFTAPIRDLIAVQIALNAQLSSQMKIVEDYMPQALEQHQALPTTARPQHTFAVEGLVEADERNLREILVSNERMIAELHESAKTVAATGHAYREQTLSLIFKLEELIKQLDQEIHTHFEKVNLDLSKMHTAH